VFILLAMIVSNDIPVPSVLKKYEPNSSTTFSNNMFRKRQKKYFPPGTFIPTPARIVAILQLCIVFTVILSSASYPFLGEIFHNKSQAMLYSDVMGNASAVDAPEDKERLIRNVQRFDALPKKERTQIQNAYHDLQDSAKTPFFEKVSRSFSILAAQLPAFKQAWIFFSVAIALLLLLRIEGAVYAAWLLPIIALAYAWDNNAHGIQQKMSEEERLFPSEAVIVHDYLHEPLSSNILEQQKQLQEGWQLYLVDKWSGQKPSKDVLVFKQQIEEGEFKFNLARIKAREHESNVTGLFRQKEHVLTLLLYVLWNLFFAWTVNRKKNRVVNFIEKPSLSSVHSI
jgi:hypothetical protein